jgi:putative hydrolases of HD superfamily
MMTRLAEFLFEAALLKRIQRTGYQFLGTGHESVAEHTFVVAMVGWALAQLTPGANLSRLLAMCLVHDLPESRIGDLNQVQKQYVTADPKKALDHLTRDLPFGEEIRSLLDEFNARETVEARLVHDADQLAFLLDLKSLADTGCRAASRWRDPVTARLETVAGIKLSQSITETAWDTWWSKIVVDSNEIKQ